MYNVHSQHDPKIINSVNNHTNPGNQTVDSTEGEFSQTHCTYCEWTFSSMVLLNIHTAKAHIGELSINGRQSKRFVEDTPTHCNQDNMCSIIQDILQVDGNETIESEITVLSSPSPCKSYPTFQLPPLLCNQTVLNLFLTQVDGNVSPASLTTITPLPTPQSDHTLRDPAMLSADGSVSTVDKTRR